MVAPTPRRITNRVLEVSITGHLAMFRQGGQSRLPFGVQMGQPVMLEIPGSPHLYLAVFSTKGKLDTFLADYSITHDKIVSITDGREFLSSIPKEYRIIIDPYKHENGNMRYQEILR